MHELQMKIILDIGKTWFFYDACSENKIFKKAFFHKGAFLIEAFCKEAFL